MECFVEGLGGGVEIATGSYTGTGTYGSSNPNSLTFDFIPKIILIPYGEDRSYLTPPTSNAVSGSNLPTWLMLAACMSTNWNNGGLGFGSMIDVNPPYSNMRWVNPSGKISADGKTVYWYSPANASNQFNTDGATYYYIAMG